MGFKTRNGCRGPSVTFGTESEVAKQPRSTERPTHGMAERRSTAAGFVAAFADRPSAGKFRATSSPVLRVSPEGIKAVVREWVAPTPEEMSFHVHLPTTRLFFD